MKISFEELREVICDSDKGKVVDSLICCELGLEDYKTLWAAHLDVLDAHPIEGDAANAVVTFLVEISDYLDFNEVDFDKILGATA